MGHFCRLSIPSQPLCMQPLLPPCLPTPQCPRVIGGKEKKTKQNLVRSQATLLSNAELRRKQTQIKFSLFSLEDA